MKRVLGALMLATALMATPALSEPTARPDVALSDPAAEARARALFADIRCVVCQHESISDSPAAIAADLRGLVREQIEAGKSDEDIRADLVNRYGDYVLFTPPFRAGTLILWLGPLLLVLGAGGVFFARSRKRSENVAPLAADEEAALAQWMTNSDENAENVGIKSDNKDI